MDCEDEQKTIFLGNHGSALLVELNRYDDLVSLPLAEVYLNCTLLLI